MFKPIYNNALTLPLFPYNTERIAILNNSFWFNQSSMSNPTMNSTNRNIYFNRFLIDFQNFTIMK